MFPLGKNLKQVKNIRLWLNYRSLTSNHTEIAQAQMDEVMKNPFFAKYKDKLQAAYNNDPQAFNDMIKRLSGKDVPKDEESRKRRNSFSTIKERKLDAYMKIEMLQDLPREEIVNIWNAYHTERLKVSNTFTKEEYVVIEKRSQDYPVFVYPLPRENQGYEFVIGQWLANECHFTSLINYQAHGENAPSTLTFVFYRDLIDSKEIVLQMSEFDTRHCSQENAQFLHNQIVSYYLKSRENDSKLHLLATFNKSPSSFKHMDLIEELKRDTQVQN